MEILIMNREKKFRSWDCKNKIMITDALELTEDRIFHRHSLVNADNVIWEQFTGFKDKKGKEIYEGDILSDFTQTDEGVKESFCQVFYDKIQGAWKLDKSYYQDKSYSINLYIELREFEYEISGNIHETNFQGVDGFKTKWNWHTN